MNNKKYMGKVQLHEKNKKIVLIGIVLFLATAAIFMISLMRLGTMKDIKPITVMAEGSFSGIGKIVEDYSDEPYVILDIVPSEATYSGYTFSTGTMGYLVNGQAPIAEDLSRILADMGDYTAFGDRKELIDAVIASNEAVPGVVYEEAYGGTRDISESEGWIFLTDSAAAGLFYAIVEEAADGDFIISGTLRDTDSESGEEEEGDDEESGNDAVEDEEPGNDEAEMPDEGVDEEPSDDETSTPDSDETEEPDDDETEAPNIDETEASGNEDRDDYAFGEWRRLVSEETYMYVGPGQGNCKLTWVSEETAGAKLVAVQNVPVYFRCRTTCDWIKQYVFETLSGGDNENSNFTIEVETVRADRITHDMIREADLIYLESGLSNPVLHISAMEMEYFNSGAADMQESAVNEILHRVVDDLTPMIVDYDIVKDSDHYKDTNYQYLARTLLKRDLAEFYAEVNINGTLMDNIRKGVYDDAHPDKTDNNYNYVNQNVYVVNDSTPLVSEDFPVSKAKAVQYIVNYSAGMIEELDGLTVLELQPTANSESALQDFHVDPVIKSVAEFNGEWEDLNGTYDIVFIGLDGQRLNLGDDADRTPRYNNALLDGKVYHSGDDSGVGKYDANDITEQKMTDLLEYLAAGYPVLVENNCFKNGSAQKADAGGVNTKYIGEDTVMYRFLQTAVTDERYKACIFTVEDAMFDSRFMTQAQMVKPRISLLTEDGSEAACVQSLTPDGNGEYHGRIAYIIKNNRGGNYLKDTELHLYVDYNYDGIFQTEEEITEYLNDGSVLDVKVSDMGTGILPWKLEVTDTVNAYRRDSVQGYFEMHSFSSGELKVLQITEKKDDNKVNLQTIYNRKDESLLAYYLRGAEDMLNIDMQLMTVTLAELESRLIENGKYLEQWDVVALTLDGAVSTGAVADAVNRYAGAGRSLLVCGQDSDDERMGLGADLLGQTDGRTYVSLGAHGEVGYPRYAGLDADMYSGKTSLQAQTINEGIISHYPYEMHEKSFTIGENTLLKASSYLLDFDGNTKTGTDTACVTVWHTFGGGDDTAYGISPKDARNNYYCYSKGNVVYLAQSEYPYTYDSRNAVSGNEAGAAECKFFVNALMAAYSAGVHNADVHIVAGFAPDSADVESIVVPYDETWLEASDVSKGLPDHTVDVYFRFDDGNIAGNKVVQVSFLYEDPSVTDPGFDIGGRIVKATPFESQIWAVENNSLALVGRNQLKPGNIYCIKAPVVTFKNDSGINKADIYIVVQSSFAKGSREYSVISSDAVSLNRAQLFPLE